MLRKLSRLCDNEKKTAQNFNLWFIWIESCHWCGSLSIWFTDKQHKLAHTHTKEDMTIYTAGYADNFTLFIWRILLLPINHHILFSIETGPVMHRSSYHWTHEIHLYYHDQNKNVHFNRRIATSHKMPIKKRKMENRNSKTYLRFVNNKKYANISPTILFIYLFKFDHMAINLHYDYVSWVKILLFCLRSDFYFVIYNGKFVAGET